MRTAAEFVSLLAILVVFVIWRGVCADSLSVFACMQRSGILNDISR